MYRVVSEGLTAFNTSNAEQAVGCYIRRRYQYPESLHAIYHFEIPMSDSEITETVDRIKGAACEVIAHCEMWQKTTFNQ